MSYLDIDYAAIRMKLW